MLIVEPEQKKKLFLHTTKTFPPKFRRPQIAEYKEMYSSYFFLSPSFYFLCIRTVEYCTEATFSTKGRCNQR